MRRPSLRSVVIAAVGGFTNVAVVLALYARASYPTLESTTETSMLALFAFVLGFVAFFGTAHTRLLTPASGFLGVLGATVYMELSAPQPEWGELNGYVIVDGPTHIASYANTWYVWLALVLFVGVAEFGIRRGYGIGEQRLRNLPQFPLSRGTIAWTVAGFAGFVGLATMQLVIRSGIRPTYAALFVFAVAAGVAAIPLAALLVSGLLLPLLLFAPVVPYFLAIEVFTTTDSPVHILLFGPYAIILALSWELEAALRSRLRGWNGGRFVSREDGQR